MSTLRFRLNGAPVEVEVEGSLTALALLRDRLGVTSAKDGCSPQGACGCCTVMINGKAVMSCLRGAEQVEGAEVVTLEGLDAHRQEVLARSFVEVAGLQCGYCVPGIAVRAADLLDRKGAVSADEIRHALHPHLCRCTGYTKIIEATPFHPCVPTLPLAPRLHA